MEEADFETFMRESEQERGGNELTFTPEIKPGFRSASFNTSGFVVIGAKSDIYDTLVVDRRSAPHLLPRSPEEWIKDLIAQVPKGNNILLPIQRAYVGEFIGYGLVEIVPRELMAILMSSGPKAAQLDDAYKRKN